MPLIVAHRLSANRNFFEKKLAKNMSLYENAAVF
jgi:hypothetical protein